MNNIILGIDIGGSHITAALVNLDSKILLPGSLIRRHINSKDNAEAIISSWCEVINESFGIYNLSPGKIGIAMPGPFDYNLGISLIKGLSKYEALYRLNIKAMLADRLNIKEDDIRFMNDAECFMVGEAFCGAAKDAKSALGLTLGTGFGTAWYRNGIGKDAALWSSPFKDSIAEDYFGTRWFLKKYEEVSGTKVKDVKELAEITPSCPKAATLFFEYGQNLSDFIGGLFNNNKPETLVIGGNISKAFNLFSPALNKGLRKRSIEIPIQTAKLGEEAALIGAASYWG